MGRKLSPISVGERFRHWTVLEVEYVYKVKYMTVCKCDCGHVARVTPSVLRNGSTRKCFKCFVASISTANGQTWWGSIVANAKESGREINITMDYAKDLFENQGRKCALTGLELVLNHDYKSVKYGKNTASLDRIDSKEGYIEGNVQWVHKALNKMKLDLTMSEFVTICHQVRNHRGYAGHAIVPTRE